MALTFAERPQEGYVYTINSQRGDDDAFKVRYRPLTSIELMTSEDLMITGTVGGGEVNFKTNAYHVEICRLGIIGWENLVNADGKQVPCDLIDGVISNSSLNKIPPHIIKEVALVILSVTNDPSQAQLINGE